MVTSNAVGVKYEANFQEINYNALDSNNRSRSCKYAVTLVMKIGQGHLFFN